MPTKQLSKTEYETAFSLDGDVPSNIHIKALERALDIRKFEIDLYWRRATYFWTFIAATLAGFVAIQGSRVSNKTDLAVLLFHLGIVFSFGWLCVNRGSKFWQENWEYHVDLLEDKVQGPLYKVVLTRGEPKNLKEKVLHLLTGPSAISVSKINQLISLFIVLTWIVLLIYSLPKFHIHGEISWFYLSMSLLTSFACMTFITVGRTYSGGYWHRATIRTAHINNDP